MHKRRQLYAVLGLPLMSAYAVADRMHVREDAARWMVIRDGTGRPPPRNLPPTENLVDVAYLAGRFPEFRSLLYYRAKRTGIVGQVVAKVLSFFYKGAVGLEIGPMPIGPGFHIEHGTASIVNCREWGRDGWLSQQVTVGYGTNRTLPTLGDGVLVRAGAKVFGELTVGSGCHVGANAVVTKDQPENSLVAGVPARVIGASDTDY